MGKFLLEPKDYVSVVENGDTIVLVTKEKFESFNEDILELGKIDTKSNQVNAISVLFDLEGFTNFCNQIDPQLAVPEYLSEFLKWLFSEVRKELTVTLHPEGYETYSELPFLTKYMGDGLLFLWNTENLNETEILNIVISMLNICNKYSTDFLKRISKSVSSAPKKLRCGIARGAIYSVGNGNDYVGPCINMSARLQKLGSLSFCFSRRGLNPESCNNSNSFLVKKTEIRGIGKDELVCVLKKEFETLSKEEIEAFSSI